MRFEGGRFYVDKMSRTRVNTGLWMQQSRPCLSLYQFQIQIPLTLLGGSVMDETAVVFVAS